MGQRVSPESGSSAGGAASLAEGGADQVSGEAYGPSLLKRTFSPPKWTF